MPDSKTARHSKQNRRQICRCKYWVSPRSQLPRPARRACSSPQTQQTIWEKDFAGHETYWISHPVQHMWPYLIFTFFIFCLCVFLIFLAIHDMSWGLLGFLPLIFLLTWFLCIYVPDFYHALRVGKSVLHFESFPYVPGKSFVAEWVSPRRYDDPDALVFTLRCVESVWERVGDNETWVLYECWSREVEVREIHTRNAGTHAKLYYQLPHKLRSTRLHSKSPRHWELEVSVRGTEDNPVAMHRVPIYRKTRNRGKSAD